MELARPHDIRLNQTITAYLLFVFFCFAYIGAPYWLLPSSPITIATSMALTIFAGTLWARWSSGFIAMRCAAIDVFLICLLAAVIGMINVTALNADIPWRGDEDYHITIVYLLLKRFYYVAPAMALCILAGFALKQKRIRLVQAMLITAPVLAAAGYLMHIPAIAIVRYPFISRFFQVIPPLLADPLVGTHVEITYRLVPLACVVAIAWLTVKARPFNSKTLNILTGIAVSLIPIVQYYTSILYLEMPAVVMMLIVCLHAPFLLTEDFESVRQHPAWYALIAIGFVKETVLPFLGAVVVCRLLFRTHDVVIKKRIRPSPSRKSFWLEELRFIFCATLPAGIFIGYRLLFGESQTIPLNPANLLNGSAYRSLLQSYADQFGIFCVFFIFGAGQLLLRKEFRLFLFLLLAVIGNLVLYTSYGLQYAGYSRFNLFILPVVLTGSISFFKTAAPKKFLPAIIVCLIFAVNIALTPVQPDGAKKPMWGVYGSDTGEHYFPYRDTIAWLKSNHGTSRILFTGMHYSYPLRFYFYQLNWAPAYAEYVINEADYNNAGVVAAIEKMNLENVDILVCQIPTGNSLYTDRIKGFQMVTVFENSAHALAVYKPAEATR